MTCIAAAALVFSIYHYGQIYIAQAWKDWFNTHNKEVQSLSGVYYVHLPEVLDECGTEFAIDGPEEKARHMEPPRIGQWVIYPSNYWHRPGILKSKENRYIVAADLWY